MEFRRLVQQTITDAEADELARVRTLACPRRLRTDPAVTRQLAIDQLRGSTPTYAFTYVGLFDGDRMLGWGETQGSIQGENTDVCEIGVWLDPDVEGHGHRRRLFDHLHALEDARGRERYWGWGVLDHGPSRTFWEHELGYELAYEERVSRCDLHAVDADLMQQWIDGAAERASGYELIRAEAPLSDDVIGYYAQGLEGMNDAPTDNLVFDPEKYDISRAREVESLHVGVNAEYRTIFVVEKATGSLAGYTATRVPRSEPALSGQSDTVTINAHRNKGIGRWMKADMWQWLRSERPEVQSLDTGNAESNRAMLAINEAMGFKDIFHEGVWHQVE